VGGVVLKVFQEKGNCSLVYYQWNQIHKKKKMMMTRENIPIIPRINYNNNKAKPKSIVMRRFYMSFPSRKQNRTNPIFIFAVILII
jgi:hypothetical protein